MKKVQKTLNSKDKKDSTLSQLKIRESISKEKKRAKRDFQKKKEQI